MKIGCVILAGGKSTRMGTDKALLSINGESFVAKICNTFSFFEEKFIARGDKEEMIDVTWSVISDPYPHHGPIGGLYGALSKCQSDAMFCVACDSPFLKKNIYECLLKEWTEKTDVVIAVTEDGKCHPLCGIYRKSVGTVMEEHILKDNNKMMDVLKKVRTKYVKVDKEKYGLYNINTVEEFSKFTK